MRIEVFLANKKIPTIPLRSVCQERVKSQTVEKDNFTKDSYKSKRLKLNQTFYWHGLSPETSASQEPKFIRLNHFAIQQGFDSSENFNSVTFQRNCI